MSEWAKGRQGVGSNPANPLNFYRKK